VKIGIVGTGIVGTTLGDKLVSLGHEVVMGSRSAGNEKAVAWAAAAGERAGEGSFADAAAFAEEVVVNAAAGSASLEALGQAGAANLSGKILIDVANPLDFSAGFPPTLTVSNTDSLGEQIQREFPRTKVVKAFNTMTALVMVQPSLVPGSHVVFVAGNDAGAKTTVGGLIESFGWQRESIIDLGDISASRGLEMFLTLWVRLYAMFDRAPFNIAVPCA
jgi:hypothetical protein